MLTSQMKLFFNPCNISRSNHEATLIFISNLWSNQLQYFDCQSWWWKEPSCTFVINLWFCEIKSFNRQSWSRQGIRLISTLNKHCTLKIYGSVI